MIQLAGLWAPLRPYAEYTLEIAHANGIDPIITSTYRPWAEQQRLYDEYKRGERSLPANPPGQSAHNYGLAWDSYVPPDQQDLWDRIRSYVGWKLYPNDPVHAELPDWRGYISWS